MHQAPSVPPQQLYTCSKDRDAPRHHHVLPVVRVLQREQRTPILVRLCPELEHPRRIVAIRMPVTVHSHIRRLRLKHW